MRGKLKKCQETCFIESTKQEVKIKIV
jgi:hypothetical protein